MTRETINDKEYKKFDEANAVKTTKPAFVTKIDEASSTVTYVGEAVLGSATSSAVWRIKKIVVDSTITTISYADGVETFIKVWDDRATYSY